MTDRGGVFRPPWRGYYGRRLPLRPGPPPPPTHASGTGTITLALALVASGAPGQSPLPPRSRPRWQFVAGPATGGYEYALTAAKNRSYTARLTDQSELGFTIDGRHPEAATLTELASDVHLLFTGDDKVTFELDRFRVGTSGDDLDDTSHKATFTGLDYKGVLARRRLYAGATLVFTGIDQGEIVWSLISYTQGLPGGYLGIAKGWVGTSPTGIPRDRTFAAGDSIGERIQELSEVSPNGFDWDVSPNGPSSLVLQIWAQRGTDRGVVLEYGGLIKSVRREVSPADYANAIRQSGADGLVAQDRTATDIANRPEGRWDAVFGDTNLLTQAAVNERSDWQLGQSQVVRPTYTVTLIQGGWKGPTHIWLGDTVQLIVMSGRLQVNTALRVYEIQIQIDDTGGETVTLTLGGPRPDTRRRVRDTERRLTDLERR
jgi:hypothetical protein